MRPTASAYFDAFFQGNPKLAATEAPTFQAIQAIADCYRAGGKVLTAGSGGSASDAEHITGELLKSFRCKREPSAAFKEAYIHRFGADEALQKLEGGLPAVFLGGNFAVMTAILNDIGAENMFAQQAYSLCKEGDVLLALSTSGNSQAIVNAVKVAQANGTTCVAITGETGGKLKAVADITITVPSRETYLVQELHIQIYHLICACIELEFFGE
ncbi:MAG: SIS domain-containing protein [Oscillospiraceae bacterium]|jgi:D-sedoheptulose 7-phosphate isomerase|nr:SIS domain-containing protein [Oscillospiraceae bacterium]